MSSRRKRPPAPRSPAEDSALLRRAAAPQRSRWLLRLAITSALFLGTTVLLGYQGWLLAGQRNAALDDAQTARISVATCSGELESLGLTHQNTQRELATCTSERAELDVRHRSSTTNMAALSEDLSATRKELEELRKQREETAKRLAAFSAMTAKFRKMIDSGKLDVEIRDGRMVVKLPASVLFPSGSADLSREGELALMEVAIVLRSFPDRRFMIVGHTDNRPLEASANDRYEDNWDLSTARAVRVTRFMMEAKLDPKNLLAAGRGQFDPVASNRTSQGRQDNRRIEIVLLPNLEELPALPAPDAKGSKGSKGSK